MNLIYIFKVNKNNCNLFEIYHIKDVNQTIITVLV